MRAFAAAAFASAIYASAAAQTPYVVADLNTSSAIANSSNPLGFFDLNGTLVFTATTSQTGRELWTASNGTASLIRDIRPGSVSSLTETSRFWDIGAGIAFFAATDQQGTELWVTDATPNGTLLLKDVNPSGSAGVSIRAATPGKLYFAANDGVHGNEPWVSDGTAAGTRLLADLDGTSASTAFSVVPVGNRVFLFARGSLWVSDGTPENTTNAGVTALDPRDMTVIGETVFFTALSSGSGRELWKTDGTIAGTQMVKEIRPGTASAFPSGASLAALGSTLLFVATDDGSYFDLWTSDGTSAGTQVARESIATTSPVMAVAGNLVFLQTAQTLLRTDGTAAGTLPVVSGTVYNITYAFGRAFFVKWNQRYELWSTDGTAAGTQMMLPTAETPFSDVNLSATGGKLYFSIATGLNGVEPWVCEDGTAAGTHLLANVAHDAPPSSNPRQLTGAESVVYFRAEDGIHGQRQLWRSDGTPSGTILLTHGGSRLEHLTARGNELWFKADYHALWRSNGSAAGTQLFSDTLWTEEMFASSNYLYFDGYTTSGTAVPWRTDGTVDGTISLDPGIRFHEQPINPRGFVEQAGRIYTVAHSHYPGIFVTTGTPQTTRRVTTFDHEEVSTPLVTAAGALFFGRSTPTSGIELWRSDGTLEGTRLVKEINPGTASSSPSNLTAAGSYVFFAATDGIHGQELWRSDGTEGGTILLKDIALEAASSTPAFLTAVGNIIYFAANDGTSGVELWRSDGTPEGTVRVSDISPGAASSNPASLAAADGSLFFAADDGVHGVELWRTTAIDGVTMVADLEPGSGSSSPAELVVAGRQLFFAATTSLGRELWAAPLGAASLAIGDVRVAEGNSGTTVARFTVTRSGSTASSASAIFSTFDGSAAAGADYVANSGTVAFAAGESARTIDVIVNGDGTIEESEAFFVMLTHPAGASIARATATAFIDDDDRRADLKLEWLETMEGWSWYYRRLRVTNHGPSTASNVVLRYSESPYRMSASINGERLNSPITCWLDESLPPCLLEPIPPGASIDLRITYPPSGSYQYVDTSRLPGRTVHASVSAAESDANPADNALANMFNEDGQLILPPFMTVLTTSAARIVLDRRVGWDRVMSFESESPGRLVANPSAVTIPAGTRSADFSLSAGTLTGSVRLSAPGFAAAVMVPIVAPGAAAPLDVALYTRDVLVPYGEPADLYVEVAARRPDGIRPTGSVALIDPANGSVVAQQTLVEAATTFRRTGLAPGDYSWGVRYDGDGIFNPLSAGVVRARVETWQTQTLLEMLPIVCSNAAIKVIVRNEDTAASPTGAVRITVRGVVVATVPLEPSGVTGESRATYAHTFIDGESYVTVSYLPSGTFQPSSDDQHVSSAACVNMGLSATGTSRLSVNVTWTPNGAHHYQVIRIVNPTNWTAATTTGSSYNDSFVAPESTYLYFVRGMNADNSIISQSIPDLATTYVFVDDPAAARSLPIRAAHITQLQEAISALWRFGFSRPFAAFTTVRVTDRVRAAHLNELRTAITETRRFFGVPPVTFTDTLAPGVFVKTIHLQELRNAVK